LRTKTALTALFLVAGLAAGTQMGFAESVGNGNEPAETQALATSKVTLVQAVQAAETKAGGKAISVDFKAAKGAAPFYQVEIATADGSRQDLAVDASTGEIMKVAANGDEQDGADENGKGENGSGENGSGENGQN
jgi:uncharacterized membrane protein YkoI